MKKKIVISPILSIIFSMFIVVTVLAGAVADYGTLVGAPLAGQANWTAWRTLDVPAGGGPPYEILTEDNPNSSQGTDLGYQDSGWLIFVRNFEAYASGNTINMLFGGLGTTWSGTIWQYSFIYDRSTSTTIHDPVEESTTLTGACPILTGGRYIGSTDDVVIIGGVPLSVYYIYRSQNAACEECLNSNGDYFYLASVTTNADGIATYNDNTTLQSWYIAVKAGDQTTALGGCHSEEINPTAVTLMDFNAAYDHKNRSVALDWEIVSAVDIFGFKLLRSERHSGDKVQVGYVNANPVDLQYGFTDPSIELGKSYDYWLEVEGIDGSKELYGPVNTLTGYILFMPLLQR